MGHVLLCGPERRSWDFALPDEVTAVGIRFRAGQVRALFDIDVSDITDRQVPLERIVGAEAIERLVLGLDNAAPLPNRRESLLGWFGSWAAARQPDPVSDAIMQHLVRSPDATKESLASALGVSPRTLHRRAMERFGYGTATLTRLVRFQQLVALALTAEPGQSLGALAAQAGYADHAHLVRDCRDISDQPPSAFLAEHFATFPDLADPYKTQRQGTNTLGL